ncbi:unnamed protein product [Pleuronectes platessa]|uniref:Uncharacterized protein n=1 Tax=Pleuronectes platessa TaxID=8262 RepID=A0A9N7U9R0_PLEPL|nr:unnamed protein product [Pleuronectes platessa]
MEGSKGEQEEKRDGGQNEEDKRRRREGRERMKVCRKCEGMEKKRECHGMIDGISVVVYSSSTPASALITRRSGISSCFQVDVFVFYVSGSSSSS